ncbi:molybdopterin-binding protein [Corynebacterium sp. ES2794-CONJ1]|uniref:MogA/MoaB family molybdenum cofactor biosynthesis protein n=1 Tax=unclassified Corynebacterium TaxID=2624378 RepID=UPI0021698D44|nr:MULTISPECIES: molybdopterin-binding protein [unclassified Corynebacterium]MCS4490015.1 molybdopterin-binding protein [Corynebacterium sp. ES2775-CONJ]MCS4531727.1 molybdopterin-binding protein [Corynebacterium sp. ES2730-CONJ]MCU9519123.1 molybdopterin-binding protein [Corynebacterium sp. ES2794-CONJ1]
MGSKNHLNLPRDLSKLSDIREPDDDLFFAQEQAEHKKGLRRALAVLVTDSRDDRECEATCTLVAELLAEGGFVVDGSIRVPAKASQIRNGIEAGVIGGADLVVTIGGTGVGPRDKTLRATKAVLDQEVPGIAQALRFSGMLCNALDACTSRGTSGVSGSTVVVNLAGSRTAIRDGMATMIPLVHHLVDQLRPPVTNG